MEFKDYYKIMGLEPSADAAEIKKAYRKLARKYHPDVSKEDNAEQKFKDLGEAYEVLKDPDKRAEYDALKAMGGNRGGQQFRPPPGWESATHFSDAGGGGDFSDFFESIFGRTGSAHRSYSGGRQQGFSMRGEDIHSELKVPLDLALKGGQKQIRYRIPKVDDQGFIVHQDKTLNIKIPAGATNGQVLRLKGQGGAGVGGGPDGDLLLTISFLPHRVFTVEGKDVSLVVPLAPWEAALGTKITVPTLDSKAVVTIPPDSQTGKKMRLAGKGLGKPPGDFFVVLKVVMPDKNSDKAKALFTQLAEEQPFNPRADWETNS